MMADMQWVVHTVPRPHPQRGNGIQLLVGICTLNALAIVCCYEMSYRRSEAMKTWLLTWQQSRRTYVTMPFPWITDLRSHWLKHMSSFSHGGQPYNVVKNKSHVINITRDLTGSLHGFCVGAFSSWSSPSLSFVTQPWNSFCDGRDGCILERVWSLEEVVHVYVFYHESLFCCMWSHFHQPCSMMCAHTCTLSHCSGGIQDISRCGPYGG